MPVFRVSEPALLPELLADLTARPDFIVEAISKDTFRVNILGSYNSDALRMAASLRVKAWQAAQSLHGVDVDVDLI